MGDFCTVDQSLVNGFMKQWIYQFYLLSLSFLVYDFDRTFILDLQKQSNAFLKKWAGINKSAEMVYFFVRKKISALVLLQLLIILRECN